MQQNKTLKFDGWEPLPNECARGVRAATVKTPKQQETRKAPEER